MDRYRLIAGIVVCFVYLLALFPWQTITVAIVIAIAYYIFSNMGQGRMGEISVRNLGRELRRREALNNAAIYLAPYNSIWRNLKLSNTYCSLRLQSNGYTIVGRESIEPYRTFRITKSNTHPDEELWNMFCNMFDHNTRFDRLIELCRIFQTDIKIEGGKHTASFDNYSTETHNDKAETPTLSYDNNYLTEAHNIETYASIKVDAPNSTVQQSRKEKLDVNNASEVELTALPGISIVLAKKIIKRREEIGGFKDISDFLQFTQLKPHMRLQIEELVCVNKMRGSLKINRYEERKIDL